MILVLIVDECSLLDANPLGAMENNAQQTAYSSKNDGCSWGNIPVILMFSDYYQLPSISPGVLDMIDNNRMQQVLSQEKSSSLSTY